MPRKLKHPSPKPPGKWSTPLKSDDRNMVTIVVTSQPDQLGRQSFWIRWYDDRCMKQSIHDERPEWRRGWRAQHFFALVRYYQAYWSMTQLQVQVVEELCRVNPG